MIDKNKTIKIFSTPTCHYCHQANDYLISLGYNPILIDVSKDLVSRKEMVELSSQMGVPVIIIGDKVLVGFNKDKIDEALK